MSDCDHRGIGDMPHARQRCIPLHWFDVEVALRTQWICAFCDKEIGLHTRWHPSSAAGGVAWFIWWATTRAGR